MFDSPHSKKCFHVLRWNFMHFNSCFLLLVSLMNTTEKCPGLTVPVLSTAPPMTDAPVPWQSLLPCTDQIFFFTREPRNEHSTPDVFQQCWAEGQNYLPQSADNFLHHAYLSGYCWPFLPWGCIVGSWAACCRLGLWKGVIYGWPSFLGRHFSSKSKTEI